VAYTYRRTETVQSGQITGALAPFHALFSRTHNDFRTVGNGGHVQHANGYDLNLFENNLGVPGTMLKMETESYNAATGAVSKWGRVPSIAVSSVVWWQYGDSGISSSQDDAASLWSEFQAVYHFGNGALALTDSTSNGRNLTNNNTVTLGTGQIGGAASFARASSQYLSSSYGPALGDFQVSCWFKSTSKAAVERLVDKQYDTGMWMGRDAASTDHKFGGGVREASDPYGIFNTGFTDGSWHLISSVRSGTTHKLYRAGVLRTSNTVGSTNLDTSTFAIGGETGGVGSYFNGLIDEVRISLGGWSDGQHEADFNNQSSPTTFWGLGAEISQVLQLVVPVYQMVGRGAVFVVPSGMTPPNC